jgi:hypothetical protein
VLFVETIALQLSADKRKTVGEIKSVVPWRVANRYHTAIK